ncbi:hypothetical protein EVAR_3971_1 [Eumeta japonica]|uniref:Uncharacterized protein n=1 Tax=Eumeta variegata TaxID=151549 RepID=A0A4C1STJ2_EUMVA|nr:hypothetical protein EVAR_3971_1 [Eumeta japonica]
MLEQVLDRLPGVAARLMAFSVDFSRSGRFLFLHNTDISCRLIPIPIPKTTHFRRYGGHFKPSEKYGMVRRVPFFTDKYAIPEPEKYVEQFSTILCVTITATDFGNEMITNRAIRPERNKRRVEAVPEVEGLRRSYIEIDANLYVSFLEK